MTFDAQILLPDEKGLEAATRALKAGDLVAVPTETVYGLAGDATQDLALAKIFDAKRRPSFDPLIIHVADFEQCLSLVNQSLLSLPAQELLRKIASTFWPGPLTLVLPKASHVSDLATSGLSTVAVRIPASPITLNLIKKLGSPIAAPSANRFGKISPTSAMDVKKELGQAIHWIVDGGDCKIGVESTILEITFNGELRLLRPGGTSSEDIKRITGLPIQEITLKGETFSPQAPGMLESHYAPSKPMKLISELNEIQRSQLPEKIGILSFEGISAEIQSWVEAIIHRPCIVKVLSPSGNSLEAAKNLFKSLRQLDESDAKLLFAIAPKNTEGLNLAISDRLRRASQPKSSI